MTNLEVENARLRAEVNRLSALREAQMESHNKQADFQHGEIERLTAELEALKLAVETEPEFPGKPPFSVLNEISSNPQEALRATVRLTKERIFARARELLKQQEADNG